LTIYPLLKLTSAIYVISQIKDDRQKLTWFPLWH